MIAPKKMKEKDPSPRSMTDQELLDQIDAFRDLDELDLMDAESKKYWEECDAEFKRRMHKNQINLFG